MTKSMMKYFLFWVNLSTTLPVVASFVPFCTSSSHHNIKQQRNGWPNKHHHSTPAQKSTGSSSRSGSSSSRSSTFEVTIDLPPTGSNIKARLNIESILSVPTELVVVRYKLPFGLNVEPVKGLAVVTQPGFGGERPGDILRFTTQWTLGLPSGESLSNTFASFAGGLSWQCSIFDIIKAKAWEQVVNALTSNTMERTDEVVLIFERPVGGVIPPELQ